MILYHSSPKKFDKFNLSKIGHTTNRLKYGCGFYFSANLSDVINHAENDILGDYYVYEVEVLNSDSIFDYLKPINESFLRRILKKLNEDDKLELWREYEEYGLCYNEVYHYLVGAYNAEKASEIFNDVGITGIQITDSGWYNSIYTIFSPDNLKILNVEKYTK